MKIQVYADGGKTSRRALRFAARWTAQLGADLAVATVRSETHVMETPPPLGREIPASEWDGLMVCTDGSASGKRAFPLLQQLLPALQQPVTLCWVRAPHARPEEAARADHCLAQAGKWLERCDKASRIMQLESDHPTQAIADAAGADALLVFGASMRHDVYRRTRGSLPMRVLARTEASVLLSKAPPEAEPATDEGRFTG